jgi:hypothetical protein
MTLPIFLQKGQKLDVEAYKKPKDWKSLSKTHVPFTGSPRKHPYDQNRVVLIADPFSTNAFYYDFKTRDIDYIEELASIVTIEGDTVNMARIWIRKKAVGVRCTPFIVEDVVSPS